MNSLIDTEWLFVAKEHDFNSFRARFLDYDKVLISFSNGNEVTGSWSQGHHCNVVSFIISLSSTQFHVIANYQTDKGSGIAYIGWSMGVQQSIFEMSKCAA